jgi:salicylate hydroxylase
MVSTTRHLPTLVVGGGIGGLAAALAVAQRGFAAHLVERDGFTELGAGIQLSANATRVLAELGVLDRVLARAVRPTQIVLCDAITGDRLTALRLGAQYQAHFGFPYLVAHRGDLLDALLTACREHPLVTLETGREVESVVPHDDAAEVGFADGEHYRCRTVIGADGLRSKVRRVLCDAQPAPTGFVTYRGAVPVTGEIDDEVRVWIGPDMHLVAYPIRGGAVHNLAAVFHAGRGAGPGALAAAFESACAAVRQRVGLLEQDRYWEVCELPPLPRWGHGPVTLLGDAAHAMVQYLAQGACQALEDARALGLAVATHAPTPDALRAYEHDRRDRAHRCSEAARVWGRVWHSHDPLVRGLRDRLFALRADADYREVEWLHGFAGNVAATPSSARSTVYS